MMNDNFRRYAISGIKEEEFGEAHLLTSVPSTTPWRLRRVETTGHGGIHIIVEWSPGARRKPWLWRRHFSGETRDVDSGREDTLVAAMAAAVGAHNG
jgi:hypothetical protein